MVEWLIRNMSEAAGKLVFVFMVCFFPPPEQKQKQKQARNKKAIQTGSRKCPTLGLSDS